MQLRACTPPSVHSSFPYIPSPLPAPPCSMSELPFGHLPRMSSDIS